MKSYMKCGHCRKFNNYGCCFTNIHEDCIACPGFADDRQYETRTINTLAYERTSL